MSSLSSLLILPAGGVIMYGALFLFEDEFIHVVAISFTALILTELIMVALTVRTWHYLIVLAEVLSLGIYILSLIVLKDTFGESPLSFLSSFFGSYQAALQLVNLHLKSPVRQLTSPDLVEM
jgi:hypothetical protein